MDHSLLFAYHDHIAMMRLVLSIIGWIFVVTSISRKHNINAPVLCGVLTLAFAIACATIPLDMSAWWEDHVVYSYTYMGHGERYANDPFFTFFTNMVRATGLPLSWYFGLIAAWYVGAYWLACRIMTRGRAQATLLVMIMCSSFFIAYGVNTLRAGMAISTAVLAIAMYSRSRIWAGVLALIAINIHFSVALTICAFGLAFVLKNPKWCLALWCLCLLLSFGMGNTVQDMLADLVTDERAKYLETEISKQAGFNAAAVALLKKGFRWDFVAYSLLPIVVGWYYIYVKKFEDGMYKHLYCTYIIANAVWLLVIGAFFTDRFAYLSWCLSPILLMLPLCRARLFANQNMAVAATLAVTILIAYFI